MESNPDLFARLGDYDFPVGRVQFSPFEATDNLLGMVAEAARRIEQGQYGAGTSRAVLNRLLDWFEAGSPIYSTTGGSAAPADWSGRLFPLKSPARVVLRANRRRRRLFLTYTQKRCCRLRNG